MTAKPMTLHDNIAESHPSIARGSVWCRRCHASKGVDPAECLRSGWPRCCGATMTIDSPDEQRQLRART